jgi:hypothetical protein
MFASTLLVPNRLTRVEGTAEATTRLVGFQGIIISNLLSATTTTSLGAGFALVSTHLRGSTTIPTFQSHEDQLLTFAPNLELRIAQSLGGVFALAFATTATFPFRAASLRFTEREAGTHGAQFLSLGLGIQALLN